MCIFPLSFSNVILYTRLTLLIAGYTPFTYLIFVRHEIKWHSRNTRVRLNFIRELLFGLINRSGFSLKAFLKEGKVKTAGLRRLDKNLK